MNAEVLITGLGVVSAAGCGVTESLRTLRRGVRPFPAPRRFPNFSLARPMFAAAGGYPSADRTFHLALAAAREALADAGLDAPPAQFRLGVCLGTTVACQLNDIDFYDAYRKTGSPPLDAVDRFAAGSLAERVARALRASGPVMTPVNACTSGTDAVGVALDWLRTDRCDAVLAGGADELSAIPASGFHALGLTSSEPCRPFDRDRQGLNLGEGAGVLLMERSSTAARRRRGSPLALDGYGSAADAHHLTSPHPEGLGLELAIHAAFADADIDAAAVDFINAHGTATRENDRIEGLVLGRCFGTSPRVVSTKGYTGHALGAAGGIEAVFTALALREGWISPSVGFAIRDEAIPVAPLTAVTPVVRRHALSTALAFGGNNAAIVLSRREGTP
jgi:3-oxoacyl-(acyl-carrier-protein) synthase